MYTFTINITFVTMLSEVFILPPSSRSMPVPASVPRQPCKTNMLKFFSHQIKSEQFVGPKPQHCSPDCIIKIFHKNVAESLNLLKQNHVLLSMKTWQL